MHRIAKILQALQEHYHDVKIALNYETPFQLLIAVMLSAQCTDVAVNKVTADFFQCVKNPDDLQNYSLSELEKIFSPLGLWRMKALAVKTTAETLLEKYHGQVPHDLMELQHLRGVGKKTASVVVNELHQYPVIAVDTHVYRLTQRLQLVESHQNRDRVADLLNQVVPLEYRVRAHHWMIAHGRRVCHARKPRCHECFLSQYCPSFSNIELLSQ